MIFKQNLFYNFFLYLFYFSFAIEESEAKEPDSSKGSCQKDISSNETFGGKSDFFSGELERNKKPLIFLSTPWSLIFTKTDFTFEY